MSTPRVGSRSKGLTEAGLAALGYSDTLVFRPAFLASAERPEKRLAETLIACVTLHLLAPHSRRYSGITPFVNRLVPVFEIQVRRL